MSLRIKEPHLLTAQRIPRIIRNTIIKQLIHYIDDLKKRFQCPLLFLLRDRLGEEQIQKSLFAMFDHIIEKVHNIMTKDYIVNLFNIIIDIMDFLTGKSISEIAKDNSRARTQIRILASVILSDKKTYDTRFGHGISYYNNRIKYISQKVRRGEITEKDFGDLLNSHFQTLKKYYRRKVLQKNKYRTVFRPHKISRNFVAWLKNLGDLQYSELFQKSGLDSSSFLDKEEMFEICNKINMADEIISYLVFSFLKKRNLKLIDITEKAGVEYYRGAEVKKATYLSKGKKEMIQVGENQKEDIRHKSEDFDAIFDLSYRNLRFNNVNYNKVQIKDQCAQIFYEILKKMSDPQKGYYAKIMVPVIMYGVLKMRGYNAKKNDFIEGGMVNKKEFERCFKVFIKLYPLYLKRDKNFFLSEIIFDVKTHFGFDSGFLKNSERVAKICWPYVQFAKENIVAGVICILTMIFMDIISTKYFQVLKRINVDYGAVSRRIEKICTKSWNMVEWDTLKKSSYEIKKILAQKLKGLI